MCLSASPDSAFAASAPFRLGVEAGIRLRQLTVSLIVPGDHIIDRLHTSYYRFLLGSLHYRVKKDLSDWYISLYEINVAQYTALVREVSCVDVLQRLNRGKIYKVPRPPCMFIPDCALRPNNLLLPLSSSSSHCICVRRCQILVLALLAVLLERQPGYPSLSPKRSSKAD